MLVAALKAAGAATGAGAGAVAVDGKLPTAFARHRAEGVDFALVFFGLQPKLLAMVSNASDGLQPNSDGLQPRSGSLLGVSRLEERYVQCWVCYRRRNGCDGTV